jgi:hypothetical protein
MNHGDLIQRVYEHLENDDVEKAVMVCLRIARNLQDHFQAVIFLRELYTDKQEFGRVFHSDTNHLKAEAQEFLWKKSLDYFIHARTMRFALGSNEDGSERNVLVVGVGEIDSDIEECERAVRDLAIPPGMSAYDTAAFTDAYTNQRAQFRLRMSALRTIRARIKSRCLNYAITMERQLEAQTKSQSFLHQVQNDVNNYFKARSEDVYTKLLKAAQLVDSNDAEDLSLLLTQVRRAIKAAADYFYSPKPGLHKCADGKDRELGDEQYLNRLHEYLATAVQSSSSRDLLRAEFEHLAVFARRLNDIASKGVHAEVSAPEAKQGLLGLYLFLYNVTARLEERDACAR